MRDKNIPENWSKALEKDLHKLTLIGLKKLGMKYRKEILMGNGFNFLRAITGMNLHTGEISKTDIYK